MPRLNYRVGLQRVFAVVCAAWLTVVVAIAIHERPRTKTTTARDFIAAECSDRYQLPRLSDEKLLICRRLLERRQQVIKNANPDRWTQIFNEADADEQSVTVQPDASTVRVYWAQCAAVAIGPPVFGYAVLFIVVPWIGRGFRSTP
jgi:hypothetical protein